MLLKFTDRAADDVARRAKGFGQSITSLRYVVIPSPCCGDQRLHHAIIDLDRFPATCFGGGSISREFHLSGVGSRPLCEIVHHDQRTQLMIVVVQKGVAADRDQPVGLTFGNYHQLEPVWFSPARARWRGVSSGPSLVVPSFLRK